MSALANFIYSHTPSKLFRYRDCSELNIDAFDRDRIYAVSPNLFNDPYDALFRYDKEAIMEEIKKGLKLNNVKDLLRIISDIDCKDTMYNYYVKLFGEKLFEDIKQLKEKNKFNIDQFAENLFNKFQPNRKGYLSFVESSLADSAISAKQSAAVACFSESIDSVLMWSHYANFHKGFALEYDLRHIDIKCTQCEKRNDCNLMTFGYIYPVIYSNKRYDATQQAITDIAELQANQNGGHIEKPDITVFIKAFLHKSIKWKYEKEWRLILTPVNWDYSKPIDIKQIPLAIYYGNNISTINRKILHSIAQSKNLKEYQMYIDEYSSKYEMRFKEYYQ